MKNAIAILILAVVAGSVVYFIGSTINNHVAEQPQVEEVVQKQPATDK